jgi:hypothetical protein
MTAATNYTIAAANRYNDQATRERYVSLFADGGHISAAASRVREEDLRRVIDAIGAATDHDAVLGEARANDSVRYEADDYVVDVDNHYDWIREVIVREFDDEEAAAALEDLTGEQHNGAEVADYYRSDLLHAVIEAMARLDKTSYDGVAYPVNYPLVLLRD